MKAEFHENIERFGIIAKECGLNIEIEMLPPALSGLGEIARVHLNRSSNSPIEADFSFNSPFIWLSQTIVGDGRLSYFIEKRLADCASIARHYGCSLRPTSQGPTIILEIALGLFFSGLSYYSLKDALSALQLATDGCLAILDPVSENH